MKIGLKITYFLANFIYNNQDLNNKFGYTFIYI